MIFIFKCLALCSISYERICVLFNIAAQQANIATIASSQSMETDDGLKVSAKYFQVILININFLFKYFLRIYYFNF